MRETTTIPAAVGAFVARLRREHHLTLEQIASAARAYGASWSASSVSNIERGQASLTLPTLLLLALALGNVTGRPLRLDKLLGDAEVLTLVAGDRVPVKRAWVDLALWGAEVTLDADEPIDALGAQSGDQWDDDLEDEVLRRMGEMGGRRMTPAEKDEQFRQLVDEHQMPPEPRGQISFGRNAGSLAEERAAKKLGISIARLRQLALRLWERPLEEESSRRAGLGSTPQARGRVTRVLVEEIRGAMEEER